MPVIIHLRSGGPLRLGGAAVDFQRSSAAGARCASGSRGSRVTPARRRAPRRRLRPIARRTTPAVSARWPIGARRSPRCSKRATAGRPPAWRT
jgi:hypothetical protein